MKRSADAEERLDWLARIQRCPVRQFRLGYKMVHQPDPRSGDDLLGRFFLAKVEYNVESQNHIHLWNIDREDNFFPHVLFILQLDLPICEQLPPQSATGLASKSRGYLFDFGDNRVQPRLEVWN